MKLKKGASFRKEHFGGLLINSHLNVFFVKEEVIDQMESGDIDAELAQFLVNNDIIEGEKKEADGSFDFELEEIIMDRDLQHLDAPLTAAIEITHRCNLNCPHCAVFAQKDAAKKELTTEEIFSLLDEWKEMRVFQLIISGGEPLIRDDIFEIFEYIYEWGVPVGLLTNATLITEDNLELIPPNIIFSISFDGWGQTHDQVRGQGRFQELIGKLEMLKENGRRVGITYTVHKQNMKDALKVQKYCIENGMRMKLDPVLPFGRAHVNENELLLGPEHAEEYLRVRKYKIDYYKKLNRRKFGGPHQLNIFDCEEIFNSGFAACPGTRFDVWVRYDGNVFPCANFSAANDFCLGNLREKSFHEIWNNNGKTDEFRSIQWKDFKRCPTCELREFCNFKCAALSSAMYGDYTVCGGDRFIREVVRTAKKEGITDRFDLVSPAF